MFTFTPRGRWFSTPLPFLARPGNSKTAILPNPLNADQFRFASKNEKKKNRSQPKKRPQSRQIQFFISPVKPVKRIKHITHAVTLSLLEAASSTIKRHGLQAALKYEPPILCAFYACSTTAQNYPTKINLGE